MQGRQTFHSFLIISGVREDEENIHRLTVTMGLMEKLKYQKEQLQQLYYYHYFIECQH